MSKGAQIDLLRATVGLGSSVGEDYWRQRQEIPDAFMDGLRAERDIGAGSPGTEMRKVASVPQIVVDAMMRDGFDLVREFKANPELALRKVREYTARLNSGVTEDAFMARRW